MLVTTTSRRRSVLLGLAASAMLTTLVIIGSRNLEHYDPALFGYSYSCNSSEGKPIRIRAITNFGIF